MECVGASIKIMVEIVAFSAECISGIPNNLIKKHIYHSFHLYLPYYYNSSKINIPMQLCKLHRSYLEINSP